MFHLDIHYVCYTMLVQRFEPQGGPLQMSVVVIIIIIIIIIIIMIAACSSVTCIKVVTI